MSATLCQLTIYLSPSVHDASQFQCYSTTHQPMVKYVTRCTMSWDACLTSVQTTRISWCWWLPPTSPVSPRDITASWPLWYLKISDRERNGARHEDSSVRNCTLVRFYIITQSCIPLISAVTACVLTGPWLFCRVGNPERRVVLVESIGALVVQRVPVLGCRQPQRELAFTGRWSCKNNSLFGTSVPQKSG